MAVSFYDAAICFWVPRSTSNGWHTWLFLIQTRRDEERMLERSLRLRINEVWALHQARVQHPCIHPTHQRLNIDLLRISIRRRRTLCDSAFVMSV